MSHISSNATSETKYGTNSKNKCNIVAPHIVLAILHCTPLWRKGKLTHPPPTLSTPVANTFKNKSNTGWPQDLMGLISHDWSDIQNLYLQSLGDKISGKRGIYPSSKNNGIWNGTYGTTGNTPFIQLKVPQKKQFLPALAQEMSTNFKEE